MSAGPDLSLERALRARGFRRIAGLDEAGRGALAGPVAAAAVVLPLEAPDLAARLAGVDDSKRLPPEVRTRLAQRIRETAVAAAVGMASPAEIDALGIVAATRLAMRRAIAALPLEPDHLLLDWLRLPEVPLPQTALPQGDSRALSIAAASILAKVSRDALMEQLDTEYPGYGFARHKGYATAAHRDALRRLGPSPVHRRSFAPVAATQA